MSPEELKTLKQEIANSESMVLNLLHQAKNLASEAAAEKKRLAALKARLPKA